MRTGTLFRGNKLPGRGADHPPYVAPRLKKEYSYTSTPPLSLHGQFWMNSTYTHARTYVQTNKSDMRIDANLQVLKDDASYISGFDGCSVSWDSGLLLEVRQACLICKYVCPLILCRVGSALFRSRVSILYAGIIQRKKETCLYTARICPRIINISPQYLP